MILAVEAIEMTHKAEYEENKAFLQEIEEKIKEAAKKCKYYIQLDYPSVLSTSVIKYLESLGYKVTKIPIHSNLDNYYYTIKWGKEVED